MTMVLDEHFVFRFSVNNFKCSFIFLNFEFVTRKRNSNNLTIDLVTRSEFLFFNFELVTRKQNNKIGNQKQRQVKISKTFSK